MNDKDKCIGVKFLSEGWLGNMVEVIGRGGRDLCGYDRVLDFLECIKMIRIGVGENERY
ncbi:hypothetical protein [Staphylococcus epidermidis]|uniref:hypothetical protein n=1 Tax=Staphylococcus epidermidis TaxID=1282 RepID=UPI001642E269|nr:hypothetical protein [Staphylococcus epidermidis]